MSKAIKYQGMDRFIELAFSFQHHFLFNDFKFYDELWTNYLPTLYYLTDYKYRNHNYQLPIVLTAALHVA